MGQQRLAKVTEDDLSKRPTKSTRRKTGNTVLDATSVRRGEVERAKRRVSDNVNAQASQHVIDGPVNRSIYNGFEGEQYTPTLARKKRQAGKNKSAVKIIPIGGNGEMGIGKNMTAFEYEDEIVVVDMGFLFPGDDYPGVNYIVPDITYLEQNKDKIKAVIITHGHLDHIGAFHHLIQKIPAPVYSARFTIGMLKKNMDEEDTDFTPDYHEMDMDNHERVQVSDHFNIELVRVTHSIPDSAAVVLRTPVGVIVHSGDWRLEDEPVDGKKFDMVRLTEIATKEGVHVLLNESTNVEQDGTATPYGENDIKESFDQIMENYQTSRVIISCFSSQVHRMQNIVTSAAEHGRKVAFAGFSMVQNVEIGLKTGRLNLPKNTIVTMDEISKLPDSKACVVCTGSQGEFNAVLNRMATGAHRYIKIKPSDVVVFASNPIPGNEPHVVRTVDGLMREGSDILQNGRTARYGIGPLHLSGHAKHDDHMQLVDALHPTYYVPNHGEFHMLAHNAEMAEIECGIPRDHIFVCDDGDVLEFYTDGTAARTGRVHVGGIMYDDSGSEVSEVVLKDRIHMSTEGIFVVVLTVQKGSGKLLSSPDIVSRGFIYLRDSEELINAIRQYIRQKTARVYAGHRVDMENFKHDLREEITQILYDKTKRTPIVIPVVNEIGANSHRQTKEQKTQEKRDRDFAAQEMARIKGATTRTTTRTTSVPNNVNRLTPRKRPVAVSFGGRTPAKTTNRTDKPTTNHNVDTTAGQKSATPVRPLSYRKTPAGPNPMRMWKED
ncbi:MAG: ribonuclease J [Candidatus Saccharibacteria bacterium]|nr:ribonuclease J [Candidatus Saccharibacteria bacterium]